jgi:hypothetical protein
MITLKTAPTRNRKSQCRPSSGADVDALYLKGIGTSRSIHLRDQSGGGAGIVIARIDSNLGGVWGAVSGTFGLTGPQPTSELQGLIVGGEGRGAISIVAAIESDKVENVALSNAELVWNEYLRGLRSDPTLSQVVVEDLIQVRAQLHNFFAAPMDPPQAAPGDDNGIRLGWDVGRHLLMVDVLPSRQIHWFYRNRESGEYSGGENVPTDGFPPEELQTLLDGWRQEMQVGGRGRNSNCGTAMLATGV